MSTTDIQKKLKAAIARKLKELDVYVEEELPDYVMVMVANKKEQKAMRSDLALFLGVNTEAFVSWLFEVIAKLNSASASGKTEPPERKSDVKQGVQKTRETSPSREKEKLKEKEREREREKEREREHERERKAREDKDRAEKERERRHKEEKEKAERKAKADRDARLEEERRRLKEKEAKEHARRVEREKEAERERQRKEEDERTRQRIKADERARQEEKKLKRDRDRRERSNTWSDDEAGSRLRGHRMASIGGKADQSPPPPAVPSRIVVKRKPQPANDAKGARAATGILQKAVAAANQSSVQRHSSPKRPKIMSRVDYQSGSDCDEQGRWKADEEAKILEALSAAQNKNLPKMPGRTKFIITMSQSQHPKYKRPLYANERAPEMRDYNPYSHHHYEKKQSEDEREREEEIEKPIVAEKRARHERIAAPDENYLPPPKYVERKKTTVDPITFSPIKPVAHSSPIQKEDRKIHSPVQWDGQIKLDCESSDDDEAQIDAVLAATRRMGKRVREDDESDEEQLPPTVLLSRGNSNCSEKLSGNSYSSNYSPALQQPPEAVYVPTPINTNAASIARASPILTESILQYAIPSTQSLGIVNEKCKYWPNCARGLSCGFVHPTKACSSFPNCSFGHACLFIHPPCKFNTLCKNQSCGFTHSATGIFPDAVLAFASHTNYNRPSAMVAPMMKPQTIKHGHDTSRQSDDSKASSDLIATQVPSVPCNFGAACRNPRCTFKHPPVCKFGYSCYNARCGFYHPQPPKQTYVPQSNRQQPQRSTARQQYKWKAN